MSIMLYNKAMKKAQFISIVWKEGRHFIAQCLNVDVSSFGKTKAEALKNLKEAVQLYFEDRPLRLLINFSTVASL